MQDPDGRSISVCNVADIVGANNSPLGSGTGTGSYLQSLCPVSYTHLTLPTKRIV